MLGQKVEMHVTGDRHQLHLHMSLTFYQGLFLQIQQKPALCYIHKKKNIYFKEKCQIQ